jgi:hypothetical protein
MSDKLPEPVAWRVKERINGEFDSDWNHISFEPPKTPRTIAIDPLYTADQLREVMAERDALREELKGTRMNWLRAKSVLNEFLAWHETGARMDNLQLDRIRDMAADIVG